MHKFIVNVNGTSYEVEVEKSIPLLRARQHPLPKKLHLKPHS